jgi:hypothetical protein
MTSSGEPPKLGVGRLILLPAIITLAITIFRLVGELEHWSPRFFNTSVGGGGALVGISWLPIILGPYFAAKLLKAGERPKSTGRAIGLAALGVAVAIVLTLLPGGLQMRFDFEPRLLYGWTAFIIGALVAFAAWPALFKVLLAYAYAARIPVAVIMFFAFQGNWGTHYDAPPPDLPPTMSLVPKYIWLGFVPQLALWVAFTLMVGMFLGTLAAGAMRLARMAPGAAGPASKET